MKNEGHTTAYNSTAADSGCRQLKPFFWCAQKRQHKKHTEVAGLPWIQRAEGVILVDRQWCVSATIRWQTAYLPCPSCTHDGDDMRVCVFRRTSAQRLTSIQPKPEYARLEAECEDFFVVGACRQQVCRRRLCEAQLLSSPSPLFFTRANGISLSFTQLFLFEL